MRTKTVAIAATTAIIATVALGPSAFAKGQDEPGKSAVHANHGVRAASTIRAAGSNSTPSSASTDQSGIAGITGLLSGTLSGLGVGPGNGKGKGQANGQTNGRAANGQENGNGVGLHLGPVSVHLGGGSSSGVAPTTTPTTAPAPAPTSAASKPASKPAPAQGRGTAKTITANAPAPNTPEEPRLETAPEDVPALPSEHRQGATATASARPEQHAAAYPTSVNDVEDGTAMLIGVLIVFLIGVTSVVVSAGYRSRRASHRAG